MSGFEIFLICLLAAVLAPKADRLAGKFAVVFRDAALRVWDHITYNK